LPDGKEAAVKQNSSKEGKKTRGKRTRSILQDSRGFKEHPRKGKGWDRLGTKKRS